MAFPTGWNKKHKIKIDHTKVSGSANLSNFPVLFTEANFLSSVFDNSQGKEIYTNHLYSDASLQGYWRLEDNGNDSSPNGYNLTGTAPTYTTGRFGKGGDFERDSSQYLGIADASCPNLEISGSQTWSAWIKAESFSTCNVVMSKRSSWSSRRARQIDILPNGTAMLRFNSNDIVAQSAAGTIQTGNWYHLVGVYNSTAHTLTLFVNGVSVGSVTSTDTLKDTDGAFRIGAQAESGEYFDGIIDDVAIWNRALTDAEVLGLYTGGQDLRFSSDASGSTQLAHEVVNWDIVNDKAEVWVKIPTLSYTADTELYVWYDNDAATPQARDLANYGSDAVWSNSYRNVYHSESVILRDSTSNNLSPTTTTGTPSNTAGKIGGGVDYDNGDWYGFGDQDITQAFTIEAWINGDDTNDSDIFYKADSYGIFRRSSGKIRVYAWAAGGTVYSETGVLNAGTWYHIVGTYDGSAVTAYLNGSAATPASTTGNLAANANALYIGRKYYVTSDFIGSLDELRLSTVARTAGWIATEYNNQSSPATFATPIVSFVPKVIFIS